MPGMPSASRTSPSGTWSCSSMPIRRSTPPSRAASARVASAICCASVPSSMRQWAASFSRTLGWEVLLRVLADQGEPRARQGGRRVDEADRGLEQERGDEHGGRHAGSLGGRGHLGSALPMTAPVRSPGSERHLRRARLPAQPARVRARPRRGGGDGDRHRRAPSRPPRPRPAGMDAALPPGRQRHRRRRHDRRGALGAGAALGRPPRSGGRGAHHGRRAGARELHHPGHLGAHRLAVPRQAVDEGGAARRRACRPRRRPRRTPPPRCATSPPASATR